MNNPLSLLRRIIAPSGATRGVVVEASAGIAQVATPQGLAEYPAGEEMRPGDLAVLYAGKAWPVPVQAPVYWL